MVEKPPVLVRLRGVPTLRASPHHSPTVERPQAMQAGGQWEAERTHAWIQWQAPHVAPRVSPTVC